MKSIFRRSVAALALGAALLTTVNASAAGSGKGTIRRLEVTHAGQIRLQTTMTGQFEGCTGPEGEFVIMQDDPNYDAMVSAALAAKLSGATVSFWLSGCATPRNVPRVWSFYLE